MANKEMDAEPRKAWTIFDPYDYIGMISPGAVLLLAIMFFYPDLNSNFPGNGEFGVAALGLFVIAAFSIGHILLAIGESIEWLLWCVSGMPTDWVLKKECTLLGWIRRRGLEIPRNKPQLISPEQRRRLATSLQNPPLNEILDDLSPRDWEAVTRELYATVKMANGTDRVDGFNRTRAFYAGLGVALSIIAVLAGVNRCQCWAVVSLSAIALIAFVRMRYFGKLYGRELLVTYLLIIDDYRRGAHHGGGDHKSNPVMASLSL